MVSIKVSDENLKKYLKLFFKGLKDMFTGFFVSSYIFLALCFQGVRNIYNKSSKAANGYKSRQRQKYKDEIIRTKRDIELLKLKKQKDKLKGNSKGDDLDWSPFN